LPGPRLAFDFPLHYRDSTVMDVVELAGVLHTLFKCLDIFARPKRAYVPEPVRVGLVTGLVSKLIGKRPVVLTIEPDIDRAVPDSRYRPDANVYPVAQLEKNDLHAPLVCGLFQLSPPYEHYCIPYANEQRGRNHDAQYSLQPQQDERYSEYRTEADLEQDDKVQRLRHDELHNRIQFRVTVPDTQQGHGHVQAVKHYKSDCQPYQ